MSRGRRWRAPGQAVRLPACSWLAAADRPGFDRGRRLARPSDALLVVGRVGPARHHAARARVAAPVGAVLVPVRPPRNAEASRPQGRPSSSDPRVCLWLTASPVVPLDRISLFPSPPSRSYSHPSTMSANPQAATTTIRNSSPRCRVSRMPLIASHRLRHVCDALHSAYCGRPAGR